MATTGASLEEIYKRLKNTERSRPMSANTFTDWTTEAGDTVTVKREGTSYTSQVQNTTMTWKGNGAQTVINSTGNEKRDAVSKVSRSKYGRNGGAMRNQQGLYSDVWDEDGHVHSVISQTASTINQYVEDTYKQLKAGLALTSSSAALYVRDSYNQLKSGLALTSSTAALYVSDAYKQLKSGLVLTSSSAGFYISDAYKQLKSGLVLTSSSAGFYINDAYNQLKSGLVLTSSSAGFYVNDSYKQLKAGINLTSSSAGFHVTDAYNRLKSGLAVTSSSACLYARSKNNAAEIAARINESTGQSEITLNADRVYIGNQRSTTVINGKCQLSDVTADYIGAKLASLANVNVQFLSSERGGIDVNSVSANTYYHGGVSCYLAHAVTSLRIVGPDSNNNYTLQRKRFSDTDWENVGSFSRATSLSGEWRGTVAAGKYFYVVASPQGNTCVSKQLDGIGKRNDRTWTSDKKKFTQTLYVYDEDSVELYEDNLQFNTTESYDAGYDAGRSSVSHNPTIDSVWTSTYVPSGGELLNSLKTQYENAKADGDYFCVRVNCNGTKKTYYCQP